MEGLVKMGVGEDEGLARMELVRIGGPVRMEGPVKMEMLVKCLASHSLSMRAAVSACAV